ncbi:hypothetical protein HaLaN_09466, partial [Haematococcus lacustris]
MCLWWCWAQVQLGLVQEGMTIDLSLMRSVAVDPVNKVAIADGIATRVLGTTSDHIVGATI